MSENLPCKDRVRAYVYDGLSSYFLRDGEFVPGTCSLCGATGIDVDDSGRCRAQAALTQKRHRIADGHPAVFGAPLEEPEKRGRYSLVDTNAAILVTDERAVFAGKVAPTRPLPASVEVRLGTTIEDLLDEVLVSQPERFVLGAFNKKSDMPMVFSSRAEFMMNGTQKPVRLNRARLVELLAMMERFGKDVVSSARSFRRLRGSNPDKARKLKETLPPELVTLLRVVPIGDEPEFEYAARIMTRRARTAVPTA